MKRIIPPETYKFIEAKLHNYEEIKRKIEEWELSVKYPENRPVVPGAGYISDPTANIAIKLAEPPKHIYDLKKWVELIDKTQEYAKLHGMYKVFQVWYGVSKQSVVRATMQANIKGVNTLKSMRNNVVYFLLIHALNAGLCKLSLNNIFEQKSTTQ